MDSKDFWAKTSPFQSVYTHSRISGTVAGVLLQELLCVGVREQLSQELSLNGDKLLAFVEYLVSLHDLGKIEYSFQAQNGKTQQVLENEPELQEIYMPGVRHEKTGQDFLRAFWKENGENRQSCALLSKVVGAHHQGKTGKGNHNPKSAWQMYRVSLEAELRKLFLRGQKPTIPYISKEKQGSTAAILLGIMILADWIASGDSFADAEDWISEPNADTRIRDEAGRFLRGSGLKARPFAWPKDFCGLWPNIPTDGKRPMQCEVERQIQSMTAKPLAVLIEAPMGEGKTERKHML